MPLASSIGDNGELWHVKYINLTNLKHYAKKPSSSIRFSIQPLQGLAVLIPKFLGNPNDSLGIQPRGIREDFAKVRMVGFIKLIFDNHA